MLEKAKDGPKARNDLIKLGIRKELHGVRLDDADDDETQADTQGHMRKKAKRNDYYCPPSYFTLSEPELHQFFSVLLGVKLPTCYGGKISRYLDETKKRFSGMKSHDCHVPIPVPSVSDSNSTQHVSPNMVTLPSYPSADPFAGLSPLATDINNTQPAPVPNTNTRPPPPPQPNTNTWPPPPPQPNTNVQPPPPPQPVQPRVSTLADLNALTKVTNHRLDFILCRPF
jgi:hypothetical protein